MKKVISFLTSLTMFYMSLFNQISSAAAGDTILITASNSENGKEIYNLNIVNDEEFITTEKQTIEFYIVTTTTTTLPLDTDYYTEVEYDDSPMRIGESRKIYVFNKATKEPVCVSAVMGDTDNITYSYQKSDDFITITALEAGDDEFYVYGKHCMYGAPVKISILDEQYVPSESSGDANCDDQVNMADAAFIMQCIANPDKYKFTEQGEKNADVDGSGDVTNADALKIQRFKIHLIASLN